MCECLGLDLWGPERCIELRLRLPNTSLLTRVQCPGRLMIGPSHTRRELQVLVYRLSGTPAPASAMMRTYWRVDLV